MYFSDVEKTGETDSVENPKSINGTPFRKVAVPKKWTSSNATHFGREGYIYFSTAAVPFTSDFIPSQSQSHVYVTCNWTSNPPYQINSPSFVDWTNRHLVKVRFAQMCYVARVKGSHKVPITCYCFVIYIFRNEIMKMKPLVLKIFFRGARFDFECRHKLNLCSSDQTEVIFTTIY